MRSIRLKNFRSFEDTGRIELKPITILVGANSSGKSSFLRFFPLLRQTVETRTDSPLLWFTDTGYVDFGDFGTAVRKGADRREMVVELELDTRIWDDTARTKISATIASENRSTRVTRFLVDIEATPGFQRTSYDVTVDGAGNVTQFLSNGVDMLASGEARDVEILFQHLVPELVLTPRNLPRGGIIELNMARTALNDLAKGVRYIAGVRRAPERYYRMQSFAVDEVFPQGENLAMFLWRLPEGPRAEFSRFFREHFGFSVRAETDGSFVTILLEDERGETENLADMGLGFSQVLPVAAQAWATASGYRASERVTTTTLVAVEQPEVHLHPRYQARLGDMLLGVRKATSVPLLVETHSEALISRLGELIEAGALPKDDVSVLLFAKDDKTGITSIRHSYFTSDGMLKNWPIGFFAP